MHLYCNCGMLFLLHFVNFSESSVKTGFKRSLLVTKTCSKKNKKTLFPLMYLTSYVYTNFLLDQYTHMLQLHINSSIVF